MKLALLFTLLLGASCPALAQQSPAAAKPSPPPGPLLSAAPQMSEWVISFQYPDDKEKKDGALYPDRRPRKIVTTKTGTIIHEVTTDVQGKVNDTWTDGQAQYVKHDGDKMWLIPVKESGLDAGPLPASGFRDMDWVSADTFVGTVPFGNGSCLVFVPGGSAKVDLSEASKAKKALEAQVRVAYVDADSHMPVALKFNGDTRTYHFNAAPAAMQALPEDLSDQLKRALQARARLERHPPRPY